MSKRLHDEKREGGRGMKLNQTRKKRVEKHSTCASWRGKRDPVEMRNWMRNSREWIFPHFLLDSALLVVSSYRIVSISSRNYEALSIIFWSDEFLIILFKFFIKSFRRINVRPEERPQRHFFSWSFFAPFQIASLMLIVDMKKSGTQSSISTLGGIFQRQNFQFWLKIHSTVIQFSLQFSTFACRWHIIFLSSHQGTTHKSQRNFFCIFNLYSSSITSCQISA